MKKVMINATTKIEMPETPAKAKNLSFYILLTNVIGASKSATTNTMKQELKKNEDLISSSLI